MSILKTLDEIPSLIARKAEEAEQLRLEWQQAKEHYDHDEAKFVLMLKTKGALKATEIKYYIGNDDTLYRKRLELVVLESKYRKKETEVKGLEEVLNSAKMKARLQIAEMSSLGFNERRQ